MKWALPIIALRRLSFAALYQLHSLANHRKHEQA